MTAVTATISSTGVRYAAIHEFGGTIHIPEIRPKTARALAFEIGGQTIFAAYTRAHDVHMPQRSFLASALREMTPRIREELNRAVSEVVR
jgi:phage gpG-like protein